MAARAPVYAREFYIELLNISLKSLCINGLITPIFLDEKDGLLKDTPWIIFAFLAGMMVLQLIWVLTKMPETKGVSLEDLEKKLSS